MLKRFMKYYKPQRTLFMLDMTASFFFWQFWMGYTKITRAKVKDLIPTPPNKKVVQGPYDGRAYSGPYAQRYV